MWAAPPGAMGAKPKPLNVVLTGKTLVNIKGTGYSYRLLMMVGWAGPAYHQGWTSRSSSCTLSQAGESRSYICWFLP